MAVNQSTSKVLLSDATAATGGVIRELPTAPETATLSRRAAALRDEVGLLESDAQEVHQESQRLDLDTRTGLFARREPQDLLEELGSTWGLSWSSVAKLVGVSGAAVRKWRRGETISPKNRLQLARLHAFIEMLAEYPIGDPGSWIEMRTSFDATVTGVEIYAAGKAELLFELAGARKSAQAVLDSFDSEWRTKFATDANFVVVLGPDGKPAITERRPGAQATRAPATPLG